MKSPWIVSAVVVAIAGIGTFFDLFDIFLAGVLGTVLTDRFHLSRVALPPVLGSGFLGMFIGALAVSLASALYLRYLRRPAEILLVPGIFLLVPGSIGFRSVEHLLGKDVVLGVEAAVRMIFVAVALMAGMLIGNAVAPRRRRV